MKWMGSDWSGCYTILIISVLDWRKIGLRTLNEDDVWQFCLSATILGKLLFINMGMIDCGRGPWERNKIVRMWVATNHWVTDGDEIFGRFYRVTLAGRRKIMLHHRVISGSKNKGTWHTLVSTYINFLNEVEEVKTEVIGLVPCFLVPAIYIPLKTFPHEPLFISGTSFASTGYKDPSAYLYTCSYAKT